MSLLSPQQIPSLDPQRVQEVIKTSGLNSKKRELSEILELNGLSVADVVETLGQVMRGADTSQTRLSAAKLAAELHGLLKKDEGQSAPIVNIIIKDTQNIDLNPILVPR